MPDMSFGQILQQARERKGYDLTTTARRLRIRPDILQAIEEGNFDAMPPRGYTRNMVNAYARFVGLNPTELTRMYLDEAYEYQMSNPQAQTSASPSTAFDMGDNSRHLHSSRSRNDTTSAQPTRQSASGRPLYEDRGGYATYSSQDPNLMGDEMDDYSAGNSSLPGGSYGNVYAGPQGNGAMRSRLTIIIAAAIIIILVVVILLLAFGCRDNNEEAETDIPISGLDDTTQGEGEEPEANVPVAPTQAVFTYTVDDGTISYITITEDGEVVLDDEVEGPATQTYNVTGVLDFVCDRPFNVTLTLDGEEVEPTDTGDGEFYRYTVDFSAILKAWQEEHAEELGTTATTDTATTDAAAADTSESTDTGETTATEE